MNQTGTEWFQHFKEPFQNLSHLRSANLMATRLAVFWDMTNDVILPTVAPDF